MIRWGKGQGLSFFKGINYDRGLLLLKRMIYIHKNIIHVGSSKFNGSMLSMPFHFFYDVISLQLEVGSIIIWLVVGGVACLEDKWEDVVGLQNMCGPIIEVAVTDIKEEDLGFDIAIYTGTNEETH